MVRPEPVACRNQSLNLYPFHFSVGIGFLLRAIPVAMVPWPDVLCEWLKSETSWRPGLNIQQCSIMAFILTDCNSARLVSMGLPTAPNETQRAPYPTDSLVLLNQRDWNLEKDVVYTARGFTYDGKTLDLQQASPTCLVAPVLNNPATDAGWAELFAGLGSWSWAAQTLGIQIWASVEANPLVAEAFTASPSCPAFSILRGSPGLESKAADP